MVYYMLLTKGGSAAEDRMYREEGEGGDCASVVVMVSKWRRLLECAVDGVCVCLCWCGQLGKLECSLTSLSHTHIHTPHPLMLGLVCVSRKALENMTT